MDRREGATPVCESPGPHSTAAAPRRPASLPTPPLPLGQAGSVVFPESDLTHQRETLKIVLIVWGVVGLMLLFQKSSPHPNPSSPGNVRAPAHPPPLFLVVIWRKETPPPP